MIYVWFYIINIHYEVNYLKVFWLIQGIIKIELVWFSAKKLNVFLMIESAF
jgi:hypothetical protein